MLNAEGVWSSRLIWRNRRFFPALFFIFLVAVPLHSMAQPRQTAAIAYALKIDETRNQRLSVRIRVNHPVGPTLTFAIPAWTPGYYQILHYEKNIERVHAEDETGRALPVAHPSLRQWETTLPLPMPQTVIFSYDVRAAEKGYGFFNTIVNTRAETGYVNGASALMYVNGGLQVPVTLSVDLPTAWKCVTPLDNASPENASSPIQDGAHSHYDYQAANYDELIDCPIQAGHFDLFRFTARNIPFECVLVGNHLADIEKVKTKLARIAETTINLFGSAPFHRYIFFYHIGDSGFLGGLEHRSSTVIHLDDPIKDGNDDDFITTTAHELFHAWNVKALRPIGLGPFDYTAPVRTPSLWFAEGITDYYADLLTVRAGLREPNWFLRQLADRIRQLDTNVSRIRVSAEEASLKAWEGQSEGFGGLSYYLKGSLIGCWFDLRIREISGGTRSLDDAMRALYAKYGQNNIPYPPEALLQALNQSAGANLAQEYDRYVRGTDSIPWEGLFAEAGIDLSRQRDGFLGVSFVPETLASDADDSDQSGRAAYIQHIEAGYPAEKMGLRPGDRLVTINGREVTYGLAGAMVRTLEPDAPVTLEVVRDGRPIQIKGQTGTQFSHHQMSFMPIDPQSEITRRIIDDLFAPSKPDASSRGTKPAP